MKTYKAIIFVLIVAIIPAMLQAGEIRTTLGTSSDYSPGCQTESGIVKTDIGYVWNKSITGKLSYDKETYETFIYDNDLFTGAGGRLRLKYSFTKNLNIFAGAGVLYIYDGGDITGLADSWLYGSMSAGIGYKSFILGIDHVSSPFHHADEGDSGLNTIFIGIKKTF